MANTAKASVTRQLGSLFEGGSVAGLSDRQLLERFAAGRDPAGEAAFAALVARHGPMVLGVCRQLLGDQQHAEDAFQAVFLVLARKARSIRDPDLLGNWLYGVRSARRARPAAGSPAIAGHEEGRRHERHPAACAWCRRPPADRPAIDREQAEALHGEIDRLPRAFRLPVVLCYFEGLTLDEAARRLRCPAGTLRSRLARAREKLRRGLSRRGVVLPAAALAAGPGAPVRLGVRPTPPVRSTTRAAIAFAARHAATAALSAPAAALAQEVLRTMLIHKLRLARSRPCWSSPPLAAGAGRAHPLAGDEAGSRCRDPATPVAEAAPGVADPAPASRRSPASRPRPG